MSPTSPILQFYRGVGVDQSGRTLDQILAWDDDALEAVHNYIQWLFPLTEPSRFNAQAPVLSPLDIEQFQASPDLQAQVQRAFTRMLAFYGLVAEGEGDSVVIHPDVTFPERRQEWLHRGDHNHLRLTRILISLQVLGLPNYAQALWWCLQAFYREFPSQIDPVTYRYWQQAMATG